MKINLGLCMMYPSPGVVERIGADWDWIWLDGQHGEMAGYETMLQMVRACHLIRRPAYVRVPGHEAAWTSLALDMDADAVIVPQVDSGDQARELVRRAKFPPLGNRSFGGRRVIDLHGRGYFEKANDANKLICQIESPEALANVEAIASTPGVDGLFLGPDDLMLRRGHDMLKPPPKESLVAAAKLVVDACLAHGKDCICVATGSEMIALYAALGVNYIVAGAEAGFLSEGSKRAIGLAQSAIARSHEQSPVPELATAAKALY